MVVPSFSASSSVLLNAAVTLGLEPVVYRIASPRAALSSNSRAADVGVVFRTRSACSRRPGYSSSKELWNQSGAETAVRLVPKQASPSDEKHQSSAARTSSSRCLFATGHAGWRRDSQFRSFAAQLQHTCAWRRLICTLSRLFPSFSSAYARDVSRRR